MIHVLSCSMGPEYDSCKAGATEIVAYYHWMVRVVSRLEISDGFEYYRYILESNGILAAGTGTAPLSRQSFYSQQLTGTVKIFACMFQGFLPLYLLR